MIKQLLIFGALLICTINFSSAQIIFQKTYSTCNIINGGVYQTVDNGFIVVSSTQTANGGNGMSLIKTNDIGDTIWTKTHGLTNSFYMYGWAIQQTADGGYIITGRTEHIGSSNNSAYLIKTNSIGDTLWVRTFGSPTDDEGLSVQQTSDDGFIVSGSTRSWGTIGSYRAYLVKFDLNGYLQWTKVFGTYDSEGRCVRQTNDGGYILGGNTSTFPPYNSEMYLIKTDANGDTLWAKTYGTPMGESGRSVKQTSDGGYIISGMSNSNMCLIKTDANGDTLWTKAYGGALTDIAYSVNQNADGGYILAGASYSGNTFIACMLRTNSSGTTLWSNTYDGNLFYSAQQTTDNGFIAFGSRNNKVYLVKTDINGNSGCTQGNFAITQYCPAPIVTSRAFPEQSPITNFYSNIIVPSNHGLDTTLCLSVGITELESHNLLIVSPNPSVGNLKVSFARTIDYGRIVVTNILGENVFAENIFNESKMEINLKNISSGIYFLKVIDREKYYCKKVILEQN